MFRGLPDVNCTHSSFICLLLLVLYRLLFTFKLSWDIVFCSERVHGDISQTLHIFITFMNGCVCVLMESYVQIWRSVDNLASQTQRTYARQIWLFCSITICRTSSFQTQLLPYTILFCVLKSQIQKPYKENATSRNIVYPKVLISFPQTSYQPCIFYLT